MNRNHDKEGKHRRSLKLLGRLKEALTEPDRLDPKVRTISLRLLKRTEHVMERLDGVAGLLETAARLEVDLLKRMLPIVDDLGELVRHSLHDARKNRGLGRKTSGHAVIDVAPDAGAKETS